MSRVVAYCTDRTRRGQRGYTLMEVLLVVAISGLILGPLLAWTVLVLREQPVTRDGAIRTAQSGILQAYFPADVLESGAASLYSDPVPATPAQWGTWRRQCTSGDGRGGTDLIVLLRAEAQLTKAIYSIAPMRDGGQVVPGRSSLWRSVCGAGTGTLITSTQVVEDVDPARTTASCWSPTLANGDPDAPCRQVRLQVQTMDQARPTVLSASRRTDARSLDRDADGNFVPAARIVKVSEQPIAPGQVRIVLDSSTSSDSDGAPDGSDLTAAWDLPTGPVGPVPLGTQVVILDVTQPFTVRLVVTDAAGATSEDYELLTLENATPVAVATVTPTETIAGQSTVSMSSAGSNDPDGVIASYRWRLTSSLPVAEDLEWTWETADAEFLMPAWATGGVAVQLTVTDQWGASSTDSATIEVVDPFAPPPDPEPGVDPPPDPEPEPTVPGAPSADFVATPGSGRAVAFDAGGSSGAITSYRWDFGLLAGPPGSGRNVTHTFPAPGTYQVRLTVTDDEDRSSSRIRTVVVPGAPSAPTNVRVDGPDLRWNPRPGARRYLVDFESSRQGCLRSLLDQAVGVGPNPRKALPPNPCGEGSSARARVGTQAALGGPVAYSGWVALPDQPVVK